MSYYDAQSSPASWQHPRPSWEARPGTTPDHQPFHPMHRAQTSDTTDLTTRFTSQIGKPEDPAAFGSQIDEVDRAVDNLVKSGKMFPQARRDSMPMLGPRGFPVEPHEPRLVNPMPVRHYSVPEFESIRSPSASGNLQNFYAQQRYQPRAQPEAETMMQAKRRAAAQRERDLRNYHQEQQYNRTVLAEINTYGKDRVMSPSAMSEDDRREQIARQHRALYTGHPEGSHSEDGNQLDEGSNRALSVNVNGSSAPASNAGGTRGPSPMSSFDPFGLQNGQNGNVDNGSVQPPASEHSASGPQTTGAVSPNHSRAHSGSPPLSANFSLSDSTGVPGFTNRTSASSPGGSPPRSQRGSIAPGVAPIGTRPISQISQVQNPGVNNAKRSTTPLPSPLSYGFSSTESDPFNNLPKERSASAASNEQHSNPNAQGSDGLGWSKVWGPGGKGLNNVASVWG